MMGSLILVTILMFCNNDKPIRVMKFIMPHSLELNAVDKNVMEAIRSKGPFSFCNCMASVEKVEHMISWKEIGEEIK